MAGKYTVTILPHERIIEAEEGSSLLENLFENSIFLRSDCGGKGVCGKCLVQLRDDDDHIELKEACTLNMRQNIAIEIPTSSMLSSHIMKKSPAVLPQSFVHLFKDFKGVSFTYGLAVDLGTTTIAIYLCNMVKGSMLASTSVKNPQALYGDDVMNRIGVAADNYQSLKHLQALVVKAIEWGCDELVKGCNLQQQMLEKMVVVGNPAMIHLLLGVDPASIGVAPYKPAFFESKQVASKQLGFTWLTLPVQTLPQISGFIGGDILAVAVAAEIIQQPAGTLIIDIGTNGELIYKGREGIYATSCATGPAFEGATVSCGMQAIPGAIDKVMIPVRSDAPQFSLVSLNNLNGNAYPAGLCGSGVISAAAELYRRGLVDAGGAFVKDDTVQSLQRSASGIRQYVIVENAQCANHGEVAINQRDIRSVQLGKSALMTGIELLLQQEGDLLPEKVIVAGAFGSYLEKEDMMTLGMIPRIEPEKIEVAGNLAGAGALMVLCDQHYLAEVEDLVERISVVDLASNADFQKRFVENVRFPERFLL